jgi:putative two-component system response regulator
MLVMLVDDSRSSLDQLQGVAERSGEVRTVTFTEPETALEAARNEKFDIVIVDYVMPKIDGISFITRMRAMPNYARIPIVMVTSNKSQTVRLEALRAGATDFISKSSDALELKVKLRNLVILAKAMRKLNEQAAWLAREVEAATRNLHAREEEIIFRLSLAVEYRDHATGGHTLRVANYSRMTAEEMGLPAEQCRAIYLASPLHDVGKVAIPDSILLKPGRLDDAEIAIMQTHAAIGEKILGKSSSDLMMLAAEIARHHHERWDGRGYPNGVKGSAIPLSSRIVAVADVFDALTTERPYKKAMTSEAALALLEEERGSHFDPACVDAFFAAFARMQGADERSSDAFTPARADA